MFKDAKGEKKQLPSQCFCQENKNNNSNKTLILRALPITRGFSFFFAGDLGTELPRRARDDCMLVKKPVMFVCLSRHSFSLLEALYNNN